MKKYFIFAITLSALLALALVSGCPKKPAPTGAPSSPVSSKPAPSQPAATSTPAGQPSTPAEQPATPAEQPVAATPETPVHPEKNPPGDIPDTQVFITYKSSAGMYSLKAPEGWARTESGTDVKFVDKFDGEQVAVTMTQKAPTLESVKTEQLAALEKNGRAVKVTKVESMKMPGGLTAIAVSYTSNSDPDPVTNKQIRLENVTYYYYMPGMLAALTLWAPLGADNVDQWKLISESFKWS